MSPQVQNMLTEKKIPATAVRLLVLDAFLAAQKALSLADLEEILYPTDRSTLYRTLKTFEKKGLIHGVQENNTTQYLLCHDGCREGHHHDNHLHFYCTQCKNTTCLDEVNFNHIELPSDYQIAEMKLVASGICSACLKESANLS